MHVVCRVLVLFMMPLAQIANAETLRVKGNHFVRGTPKFIDETFSRTNKVGVLAAGSSFRVINRIRLSNGAEGLEVHPVSLTPGSNLNPSTKYWIYKSDDSQFIKLDGDVTATQAGSNDVPCTDCPQPAQAQTQNTRDLAKVSKQLVAAQNLAPPTPTPAAAPPADNSEKKTTLPAGSLDEIIKKYSDSEEVADTIDYALRNKRAKSRGACYRSVKKALTSKQKGKNALVPSYYSDKAALNAKNSLKQFGFVNLLESEPYKSELKSPIQAPKGAVLVYSSGIPCQQTDAEIAAKVRIVKDCGHVEIKTKGPGQGGYVSDYYSGDAINETPAARKYGTQYKLVGVMIKKMD